MTFAQEIGASIMVILLIISMAWLAIGRGR